MLEAEADRVKDADERADRLEARMREINGQLDQQLDYQKEIEAKTNSVERLEKQLVKALADGAENAGRAAVSTIHIMNATHHASNNLVDASDLRPNTPYCGR